MIVPANLVDERRPSVASRVYLRMPKDRKAVRNLADKCARYLPASFRFKHLLKLAEQAVGSKIDPVPR